MKCRKCELELEEGVTVCPACGFDNAQPEEENAPAEGMPELELEGQPEPETAEEAAAPEDGTGKSKKGLTPGKIALLVVLAVAAVAVVIALVVSSLNPKDSSGQSAESTGATETTAAEETEATIPADGNPDDVTCKGTYYVADEDVAAAMDAVVATMGDSQLTNEQLQTLYWMQFYGFLNNYSYYGYLGMDVEQSLDTQLSIDGTTTWQQFLLSNALSFWNTYEALSAEAERAGFEMDPELAEQLETLPELMEQGAVESGYASVEEMLKADMGPGATLEGYLNYNYIYYNGYYYFASLVDALECTDTEIEAYFDANADAYAESGLEKNDEEGVAVRHILIEPEGGTMDESGNVTYSEDEWAACLASAEAVLNEWLAGEATEDSFAALAAVYSTDPGSNTNGGLYEQIELGQMVEPFENWCFDESREYGSYGIVQTTYGYHVMYFVERAPLWFSTARSDLLNEMSTELYNEILAKNELVVDYSAIVLGQADLYG